MKKHITPAIAAALSLASLSSEAQIQQIDFGTVTGVAGMSAPATSPFPAAYAAPGGATTRAIGLAEVIDFSSQDFQEGMGTGSQLLLRSMTTNLDPNAISKFTAYGFDAASDVAYTSFTLKSFTDPTLNSRSQFFFMGNGVIFENDAYLPTAANGNSTQVAAGLQFLHTGAGTMTVHPYVGSTFGGSPSIATLSLNQIYQVEVYANNSGMLKQYSRCLGSAPIDIPNNSMHVYLNGARLGGNLAAGNLPDGVVIDDLGFWGQIHGGSNLARVAYDDILFSDALDNGLSGTYTVNPAGAGVRNFSTLADLGTAMNCRGLSGAVTVNFTPGTYAGPISFGEYNFPITLNGNNSTIEYCGGFGTALITLNGTDNMVIDNFNLNAPCGTYGAGVKIIGGADNITITRNDIAIPLNTSVSNIGIYANATGGNLTITGNTIVGGRRGIQVENATGIVTIGSANPGSGAVDLLGNRVLNAYEYGIGLFNAAGASMRYNTVNMRSGNGNTAVQGKDLTSFSFENNLLINAGKAGIRMNTSNTGVIANNRIGQFQSLAAQVMGIYMANTTGVGVYHNSISADAGSEYSYGLRMISGTSGMDVQNNIFVSNSITGAPLNGGANVFSTLSHNNYFNKAGGRLAIVSGAYMTLAQMAAAGLNITGSDDENPGFTPGADFATALRTTNTVLGNIPTAAQLVSIDFENDPRLSGVDLGADEFVGSARLAGPTGPSVKAEVYPNPFSTALTVHLSDIQAGDVQVTLTDLMGRQIMSQQFGVEAVATSLSLPVEQSVAQGVYLLQVTQGEATATFRVVKH